MSVAQLPFVFLFASKNSVLSILSGRGYEKLNFLHRWAGRGMFIESTTGSFWLVGTAVEHHTLYHYQFADTKNIFASQLQTETPYYQPLPNALEPFTANSTLQDPTFACDGVSGNCDEAWGLRILGSSDIFIYGANHYSWFNNYEQSTSFIHL